MIVKLTIAEGVPLPIDPDVMNMAVGELLLANYQAIEVLEPGEYDVTPKLWTGNTHNHELVVFDNGEGLYRLFPKSSQVGFLETSPAGITPLRRGGTQKPIDAESPLAVIGGGHPTKRVLQIYGIIAYLLG